MQGLAETKNWRAPKSAARYAHVVAREERDRVDSLPKTERKDSRKIRGIHSVIRQLLEGQYTNPFQVKALVPLCIFARNTAEALAEFA
jgi:hypothetical protein